jgi:transcription elongation factor Elf1
MPKVITRNNKITITCPLCHHPIRVRWGDLEENNTVHCPECNGDFEIFNPEFFREIRIFATIREMLRD